MNSSDYVYLECVKVQSKLRVRIVSPGYYSDANCMFPRNIRVAGRKYRVPRSNVSLITTRGKYYYSVKTAIEILDATVVMRPDEIRIFEDTSTDECAICMAENKAVIVNPCGHYYMCLGCAQSVNRCPICRGPVQGLLRKDEMAAPE
jgi:hypothetical protein